MGFISFKTKTGKSKSAEYSMLADDTELMASPVWVNTRQFVGVSAISKVNRWRFLNRSISVSSMC